MTRWRVPCRHGVGYELEHLLAKEARVFHVEDMIGKSLVSTSTGERIGTVSDGLLDAAGTRLLGLVVGKGMLAAEHVLPLADVQLVGPDAVLVRTGEHVLTATEWRDSEVTATRCSALKGRRVVTEDGRLLGQVSGLAVAEETGALQAVEVEQRSLAGLRHHRLIVAAPPLPRIGPDAVVVANESLPDQADGREDV